MIKALSDTMLAAVAALLGSFIAALFKDEFNPLIFRVGMWVYAAYVLLFPLLYNMLNRWGRYLKLVEDFDQRRSRFVVRLFEQKVEGIVGERVIKSRRSFLLWFWLTVLAYVMVIGLAIASTYVVPDWMATTLGTQ
ncbi:MAG: hypothetical protein GTO14_17290 [Anaerolineales bacterium]|nr:hypothetical protein [Anaerolineales bacterium]